MLNEKQRKLTSSIRKAAFLVQVVHSNFFLVN